MAILLPTHLDFFRYDRRTLNIALCNMILVPLYPPLRPLSRDSSSSSHPLSHLYLYITSAFFFTSQTVIHLNMWTVMCVCVCSVSALLVAYLHFASRPHLELTHMLCCVSLIHSVSSSFNQLFYILFTNFTHLILRFWPIHLISYWALVTWRW